MKTIQELAERYGVDKHYAHSYIDGFYSKQMNMPVKELVEIGIGYRDLMEPFVPFFVQGASLKMWRDFFPMALILGLDIRDDALISDERIFCFHVDQSSREELEQFAKVLIEPADVVIDDGSHVHEHQLLTAEVLLPHVRSGGLYVVEDVWPDRAEDLADAIGGEIYRGTKRPDDYIVWKRVP